MNSLRPFHFVACSGTLERREALELSVETSQKRVARLQELLPAVLYLWFL